jgi:hypothetical protein
MSLWCFGIAYETLRRSYVSMRHGIGCSSSIHRLGRSSVGTDTTEFLNATAITVLEDCAVADGYKSSASESSPLIVVIRPNAGRG